MKHAQFLVLASWLAFACSTYQESKSSDSISGAYVREYSFKVVNPETGTEVGTRTVRDTIFIRAIENQYEVLNTKWRSNSYDMEGWQSMAHSEDRPMPTYLAIYVAKDGTLTPLQSGVAPTLHADPSKQTISKGLNENQRYQKTK